MGIDKPNVRLVFHYSLPQSIEAYYQESGRAGRDGQKSLCILYYNYNDMNRYRKIKQKFASYESRKIDMENLRKMVDYCENVVDCRRAIQLNYLGEELQREQCLAIKETTCDNCIKRNCFKVSDVTNECKIVASAVKDLCIADNRFTISHIMNVLKGASDYKTLLHRHNQSVHHGMLKKWETKDIKRLLHRMVIDEYLREDVIFYKDIPNVYLKVGPKIHKLNDGFSIKFALEKEANRTQNEQSQSDSSSDEDDTYASFLNRKWTSSNGGPSAILMHKEDWEVCSSSDEDEITSSVMNRKSRAANDEQDPKKQRVAESNEQMN